jgi:hypothetical protein
MHKAARRPATSLSAMARGVSGETPRAVCEESMARERDQPNEATRARAAVSSQGTTQDLSRERSRVVAVAHMGATSERAG